MADITLSKAVRSNLLSLQNTSSLLAKTQERLATGLKVNSALDNPTNFFTASSLNSRANDLGRLLDSISNANQTIEAADNGLTAITKLAESAQATARQALQTSATIETTTAATAGTATGTGFTSLNVQGVTTPASSGGVTAGSNPTGLTFTDDTSGTATFAFSAANFDEAADSISFDIDIDGTSHSITINKTIADTASVGNDGNLDTIGEFQDALDAALQAGGFAGTDYTLGNDGTNITITAAGAGATSNVNITNNANNNETGGPGAFTNAGLDSATEVAGVASDVLSFDVDVDGVNQTFSFNATEVQAALSGLSVTTAADFATLINTKLTGATAADDGSGNLQITSTNTGVTSNVDINSITFNDDGAGAAATNATGFDGTTGATGTAGSASSTTSPSVSFTVNLDSGGAQTITIDTATVDAYNLANTTSLDDSALTAQNVADLINDQLSGTATTATVSGGNLLLTSSTTGTSSTVAVGTITSTATSGTVGTFTSAGGAAASTSTSTNPKRDEFVDTYNGLLTQIDDLAKDAGFNGVNLLSGDDLSVLFNEDGSSNLDITGVTFDSAGLSLSAVASGGFDDNDDINTTLDTLSAAIDSLRAQSSKFGSNLSVVETRQNFTKETINTLETGAANLTLADSNEEAANLLALQTRQQLSSTSLSLASQADQQVLRLF